MKKTALIFLASLLLCSCTSTAREAPPETEAFAAEKTDEPPELSSETPETETPETETSPSSVIKENIDLEAFDERIAGYAAANDVVGMGLCVFAEGEIIHEVHLGLADKENTLPCDENTVYRVASVSKLISAMALMTLYDEGALDPYSDLEELTGLPFNRSGSEERVLLWHLLTHTAGLNDSYVYEISPSYYYDVSYVLKNSYNYFEPGKRYYYTNFGAGTVGAIAETLMGEYFHDFADRVIFSKLDMDAAYCADMLDDRSRCANIYESGGLSASPKSWYRNSDYYESFSRRSVRAAHLPARPCEAGDSRRGGRQRRRRPHIERGGCRADKYPVLSRRRDVFRRRAVHEDIRRISRGGQKAFRALGLRARERVRAVLRPRRPYGDSALHKRVLSRNK